MGANRDVNSTISRTARRGVPRTARLVRELRHRKKQAELVFHPAADLDRTGILIDQAAGRSQRAKMQARVEVRPRVRHAVRDEHFALVPLRMSQSGRGGFVVDRAEAEEVEEVVAEASGDEGGGEGCFGHGLTFAWCVRELVELPSRNDR